VRHWRRAELVEPTADGHFRRVAVDRTPFRAVALSFAPGEHVPEHAHPGSDEIYYVISGTARVVIEREIIDAEPGDLLFIAAGERHSLLVASSPPEPFVLLACVAPNLEDAIFSQEPFVIPPIT
jgi:quercetin dioxygenase-like cupin family protein